MWGRENILDLGKGSINRDFYGNPISQDRSFDVGAHEVPLETQPPVGNPRNERVVVRPLEALDNDVPVIISKQSGVSEVLTHALKVDFWDVNEIANKIIAVLKFPPLQMTLRNHGNYEVRRLSWKDSAAKCAKIYEEMLIPV